MPAFIGSSGSGSQEPPAIDVPEVARVAPDDPDLASRVAELDDARAIN